MGTSEQVNIGTIESLKVNVGTMLELLESQYTSFGLIPVQLKFRFSEAKEMLSRIVMSIEHLQRVLERADDKLETLYHKYLYNLQNLTTSRINTLTIIQSIFVPMTFIAGLYGMNFTYMPELNWESGYIFALSLMGLIAGIEIYIFYRNGWFK